MASALTLVATACGGGDQSEAGPTATVPPAPASTTTTNPYAVPEVIDAAYVNRVLEGLDAAYGDVLRLVAATKTIPPEAFDRLKAIYLNPEAMQLRLDALSLAVGTGLKGYRSPPGNQVSAVQEVISAGRDCIFARVSRDFSQVVTEHRDSPIEWLGLKSMEESRSGPAYNPTPWMIVAEGIRSDGSPLENPCIRA